MGDKGEGGTTIVRDARGDSVNRHTRAANMGRRLVRVSVPAEPMEDVSAHGF